MVLVSTATKIIAAIVGGLRSKDPFALMVGFRSNMYKDLYFVKIK